MLVNGQIFMMYSSKRVLSLKNICARSSIIIITKLMLPVVGRGGN